MHDVLGLQVGIAWVLDATEDVDEEEVDATDIKRGSLEGITVVELPSVHR